MKLVLAAAALAALVMSPWALSDSASAQTTVVKQDAKKKKKVVTTARVQRVAPYYYHPEYDVYVNGVYAGSDPDPRIRATIAREARGQTGLR